MKTSMQRVILFILPILMVSCNNGNSVNDKHNFTSADSTEIVKVIIDSLRAEMYTQWFMEPTHKKLQCYNPPDFNPELLIEINSNSEILINGISNPKSLPQLIVNFYSTNLNKNELGNNFQLYAELTKYQITTQIKKHQDELKAIKSTHKEFQEMIDFKQKIIIEWKGKLNSLSILGVNEIQEPHYLSGIEFKYPENSKINETVLDSILLGFYKIREIDSKKYFSESYAKIYWKAIHFNDSIAIQKLEAFKLLHPVRILDYRKSRYTPFVEIPPPPPLNEK